ncbi:MAG: hypothetical protein LC122_14430, partial [Chitinophagales bacterium]|nr:hypothetical protein [Chitinophagales bacterium]
QVDPLAEKYFGWSPYNYTLNNPLKYIDANGDSVEMGYKYIPMSGFIWGQDMYHTLLILTDEKTGEKTTIEGMPESMYNGIISFLFELNDGDGWGNLTNIPETRSAEIGSTDRETIPTPTHMTDEQFRNKLLEVNRNYQNDIEYKPFFNGESKTGNSNSFIYSVLKNSGSDYKPSRYAPGWYINVFKK